MSFQAPSENNLSAVTLIELLLVLAIISVIGLAAVPFGSQFLARNHLQNKTNELVSLLRTAQLNSFAGKQASPWGVYVDTSQITLFAGNSYAARDSTFDQSFSLPSSVSATPLEITFSPASGIPSTTVVITLTNSLNQSNTISVNAIGTVDVN